MLNCYCQLSSSVIFGQYGVSQSECKIDRPRPGPLCQGFLVSRLVLTLKPWERGCLLVYGAHGPCGIFILFLFSFDFNLFLFCFFFILPMALMGHVEFSFYFYSVLILICFYFVSFLFYLWRSWAMWNFHFIFIQF